MEKKGSAKIGTADRRRAMTAVADYKRQSRQMKLIGSLRKLIIASAEISSSITSSDKSFSADASNSASARVCSTFNP